MFKHLAANDVPANDFCIFAAAQLLEKPVMVWSLNMDTGMVSVCNGQVHIPGSWVHHVQEVMLDDIDVSSHINLTFNGNHFDAIFGDGASHQIMKILKKDSSGSNKMKSATCRQDVDGMKNGTKSDGLAAEAWAQVAELKRDLNQLRAEMEIIKASITTPSWHGHIEPQIHDDKESDPKESKHDNQRQSNGQKPRDGAQYRQNQKPNGQQNFVLPSVNYGYDSVVPHGGIMQMTTQYFQAGQMSPMSMHPMPLNMQSVMSHPPMLPVPPMYGPTVWYARMQGASMPPPGWNAPPYTGWYGQPPYGF